ncbi:hypothetical protein Asi03nite_45340 [Actinoplanes siamensis]|uniref:Uncharacterized protein n=1 Tax=Actinoplanes siamensis TaxID=1223317 RepID=A0A919TLB5_9ACTN|nr:hypothetical protein Asi03nite_45340 [Actinoplanes siamensis]
MPHSGTDPSAEPVHGPGAWSGEGKPAGGKPPSWGPPEQERGPAERLATDLLRYGVKRHRPCRRLVSRVKVGEPEMSDIAFSHSVHAIFLEY